MTDLSGKVAMVTGCASGIGAATVKTLRAAGAQIFGTDLNEAQGRALCEQEGGAFMVQDVADSDAWPGAVKAATDKFGRLDIMVNNAGMVSGLSIEDVDLEAWHRVINVNVTGTMQGCQEAIKAMKGNPGGSGGSIINIASTTSIMPLPSDVGYSTSKSAVRILSKSVAAYCAQQGYNIRCNTVIPGATATGLIDDAEKFMPTIKTDAAAMSPLNRMADPSETAAAIAFLASDECPFMTGAELLVDGGMLSRHP